MIYGKENQRPSETPRNWQKRLIFLIAQKFANFPDKSFSPIERSKRKWQKDGQKETAADAVSGPIEVVAVVVRQEKQAEAVNKHHKLLRSPGLRAGVLLKGIMKKRKGKTAKQKAWDWCSLYIRLRDAVEYQKQNPEVELGWVKCCTCGRLIHIKKNADAGHFIERGRCGLSGVYFDERNINTQCKNCNWGAKKGKNIRAKVDEAYKQFMLEKYGQKVINELYFLDRNQSYKYKIIAIGEMYKQMYKELEQQNEKD